MTFLSTLSRRHVAALTIAAAVSIAGAAPAQTAAPSATSATAVSAVSHPAAPEMRGKGRLLTYTMQDYRGQPTRATSLLFVPAGKAPAGGWPIVAWVHGTTTPGKKDCAPSLSPDLDGGLTRDGFKSDYVFQLTSLINAGYAVVAPDFEGLGPVASGPYPYYDGATFARSVISAVRAARLTDTGLSNRWAVFGHSDGGHGALSVAEHQAEAAGLDFRGTVASAPFIDIAGIANHFASVATTATDPDTLLNARLMVQMEGAFMTTALKVQAPEFDPKTIMDADLEQLLPTFRSMCSVGAFGLVQGAVKEKGAAFRGLHADWAQQPRMKAFLATNDQAANPNYRITTPTLIVQGGADTFVLAGLNTPFAARQQAAGAPLTYKLYDTADHFTVIRQANADVLAFLKSRLAR
jgi:alpha-beta hydrolase superfamily lysophospholipase